MKIIENSFAGIKEAAEILTGSGIVAFPQRQFMARCKCLSKRLTKL